MSTRVGVTKFCDCENIEQIKCTCWVGMESSEIYGTISNVWHAACGKIVRPSLLNQLLNQTAFCAALHKKILIKRMIST